MKIRYYTLSFKYTFESVGNKVYFAFSEAYTFTQLMTFLYKLKEQQELISEEKQFLNCESLCKSLSGVAIPLLTITNNINSSLSELVEAPKEELISELVDQELLNGEASNLLKQEAKRRLTKGFKPIIIIISRIYPGEPCTSYITQGFINFIISNDPIAIELRSRFVFKVIPMFNVDGVILGNCKSCISGCNLDKSFSNPNRQLHSPVYNVKRIIKELKLKDKEVFAFLSIHGNSKKKSAFFRGPYFPLHIKQYVRVRIWGKLLADQTEIFRYPACRYQEDNTKKTRSHLIISKEYNITNSFAFECSSFAYFTKDRKTIEFNIEDYEQLGKNLGYSLAEYMHLLMEEKISKIRRVIIKEEREKMMVQYKLRDDRQELIKRFNGLEMEEAKTLVKTYLQNAKKVNKPVHKVIRMIDMYRIIQNDIELEDKSDCSSSEEEMLTKEEEEDVFKGILSAVKKFSYQSCNEKAPNKKHKIDTGEKKHNKVYGRETINKRRENGRKECKYSINYMNSVILEELNPYKPIIAKEKSYFRNKHPEHLKTKHYTRPLSQQCPERFKQIKRIELPPAIHNEPSNKTKKHPLIISQTNIIYSRNINQTISNSSKWRVLRMRTNCAERKSNKKSKFSESVNVYPSLPHQDYYITIPRKDLSSKFIGYEPIQCGTSKRKDGINALSRDNNLMHICKINNEYKPLNSKHSNKPKTSIAKYGPSSIILNRTELIYN